MDPWWWSYKIPPPVIGWMPDSQLPCSPVQYCEALAPVLQSTTVPGSRGNLLTVVKVVSFGEQYGWFFQSITTKNQILNCRWGCSFPRWAWPCRRGLVNIQEDSARSALVCALVDHSPLLQLLYSDRRRTYLGTKVIFDDYERKSWSSIIYEQKSFSNIV